VIEKLLMSDAKNAKLATGHAFHGNNAKETNDKNNLSISQPSHRRSLSEPLNSKILY
jgi:hypothetical protein